MAKVNGLQGVISGKLGNTVFRNRFGKTIAAQYQPNVENRRTEGQVSQREKFKLMNQLAALFAPAIAIPRIAALTGRNQFVSMNLPYCQATPNEGVKLDAAQIQLTKGGQSLQYFSVTKLGQASTYAALSVEATGGTYTTGSAHLAVSTRPERRALVVTGLAVPINSNEFSKLVFGGVAIIEQNTPSMESANYDGQIRLEGFETLAEEEYIFVVYGYEVIVPAEQTSRRYPNAAGDAETELATIVLRSIGSNSAISNIYSATSAEVLN